MDHADPIPGVRPSASPALGTESYETERVNDLRALGVLDTAPEKRFDQLTALVREVFDAPMALISLVDHERQWFKSACGLSARQTSKELSFCSHAIANDKMLVVTDTTQDPRFSANALVVAAPYLRFYAGAVLHGPKGYPIGTLCLLDHSPRQLSTTECARLQSFADLVEHLLHEDYRRRELIERLQDSALYDPLTGLPNASLVQDRLKRKLLAAAREQRKVTVVYIDIVDFRSFNESRGREAGDNVLKTFATRLQSYFEFATVGRWHNDRFLVILPPDTRETAALELLNGAAPYLQRPLALLSEQEYHPKVRIGVSTAPDHGSSANVLMDRAALVARQPHEPGTSLALYSIGASRRATRAFEIETRFRQALDLDLLSLAYQPKVDMTTGAPVGAEALVRWHDPELGIVSPAEFVPIVECNGLGGMLGEWVTNRVCRELRHWASTGLAIPPISINVSGEELRAGGIAQRVAAQLSHDIDPSWIEFEITESAFIVDPERAAREMQRVCELGTRWALDDFGTGYSSLNYLKILPLDVVKLDREFIIGAARDKRERRLLESIISMVTGLGLTAIAEGVETSEQQDMLLGLGCHIAQGYLYAKPLSRVDFEHFLQKHAAP